MTKTSSLVEAECSAMAVCGAAKAGAIQTTARIKNERGRVLCAHLRVDVGGTLCVPAAGGARRRGAPLLGYVRSGMHTWFIILLGQS